MKRLPDAHGLLAPPVDPVTNTADATDDAPHALALADGIDTGPDTAALSLCVIAFTAAYFRR
jgi:hypothetical protein